MTGAAEKASAHSNVMRGGKPNLLGSVSRKDDSLARTILSDTSSLSHH